MNDTTYEKRGLGPAAVGLAEAFASAFPGRDNGPNEGLAVTFPNGVVLSLIWGWGTYSTPDNVEVAVIGPDGTWLTKDIAAATFDDDIADDVDGHADADRVHGYYVAAQAWKET
jgi:hypothetical protein